jgi:DNA-binding XRE family transcriptional regulator
MKKTKWRDVRAAEKPEVLTQARRQKEQLLREMPLQELRHARDLTQTALAETLNVAQSEISKIEKRTDMYVGTLRRYIEGMGGRLEIVAHFPDGDVRITQFEGAIA